MPNFIQILSQATTGALGGLTRSIVIVTRETVTGFSPDPVTGLFKIQPTDVTTFNAANPSSLALQNSLATIFAGSFQPQWVYILSASAGITGALLDTANTRPRDWSFLTLASQGQGLGDSTTYLADLQTLATWAVPTQQKIIVHTFSAEEIYGPGSLSLPATLQLGGAIGSNPNVKTIVSNSKHSFGAYTTVYDNIALALLAFVLNSGQVSRSWGSLSDAHDFAYVMPDTYSISGRNYINNNSLAQYNGARDRAGSAFVYDSQMNDINNPPLSSLIETLAAEYYIDDYVYVGVHNSLQAVGQIGLSNDDAGIQKFASLVKALLNNCHDLNLILSNADGSPAFSLAVMTAAQVTALSPNWQATGVWPAGVVVGKILPFGSAKYVTIIFQYQ